MTTDSANLPTAAAGGAVSSGLIVCPFCAEQIQAAAKKCRHCGEFLDVVMQKQQAQPPLFATQPSGSAAASSSASTTVIVHGRGGMNHALHILLCFITLGFWLPFYILIAIIHGFTKR